MQVAGPDAPGDAVELNGLSVAVEVGGEVVVRRVGEHHAGQIVEIGQVCTGHVGRRLQLAEIERLGHHPLGDHPGRAGSDIEMERVGPVAAQLHQRRAGHIRREGLAVQRAGAIQPESGPVGRARGLGGRHHAGEGDVALLIDNPEPPVVQDEPLDGRQRRRLAAGPPKGPVVPAGLVTEQLERRSLDVDQRQLQTPHEHRPELRLHGRAAEVRGAARAHPSGIGDLKPLHGDPRRQ